MPPSGSVCIVVFTLGLGSFPAAASSCFGGGILGTVKGTVTRSKPQTVALTRKLPPVIDLAGARIKISVTKTASVHPEAVEIMSTKLRAELLKDRGRGISLDDPHPDTELRCKMTTFELTEDHPKKQIGNEVNSYTVVLGNVEATVEIFDMKTGRALDSENLKDHYEKWFLTNSQQTGTGFALPLGHKPKTSNDDRLPTPSERVSAVLEAMANKIAQRLVPIDDRFDVELPVGYKELESYARNGNWGALKEKAESMPPLPKAEEDSCRLYLVGLSSEALAYREKDPKKAQDLLVNASSAYEKAKEENKSEERFNDPISRAQQSLERYITLDKIAHSHKPGQSRGVKVTTSSNRESEAPEPVSPAGAAPEAVGAAAKLVYDNQYLIKLKSSGASDKFIVSEIQDADPAQFDITPNGIAQLSSAGLSDEVKMAVKNKMRSLHPAAKKK